jgi:hypothetical protein
MKTHQLEHVRQPTTSPRYARAGTFPTLPDLLSFVASEQNLLRG